MSARRKPDAPVAVDDGTVAVPVRPTLDPAEAAAAWALPAISPPPLPGISAETAAAERSMLESRAADTYGDGDVDELIAQEGLTLTAPGVIVPFLVTADAPEDTEIPGDGDLLDDVRPDEDAELLEDGDHLDDLELLDDGDAPEYPGPDEHGDLVDDADPDNDVDPVENGELVEDSDLLEDVGHTEDGDLLEDVELVEDAEQVEDVNPVEDGDLVEGLGHAGAGEELDDRAADDAVADDAAENDPELVDVVAAVTAPEVSTGTTTATVPAVRLHGLVKRYGSTTAVDGIDLTIPAGITYGIVGPNGAGKTTTLSLIAGLVRPDRGTIEIAGRDLATETTAALRQVGVLPDNLRTFDRLTGGQLLQYYGALRRLPARRIAERARALAQAFALTDALDRPVSDYSTGMRKKVLLAGAMIHAPRVLVLDEPFESVDPISSASIVDVLAEYTSRGGTVILTSHSLDVIERLCDAVAVIVGGQVLDDGSVDEVRRTLALEERYVQLAGGPSDTEELEWLRSFSD